MDRTRKNQASPPMDRTQLEVEKSVAENMERNPSSQGGVYMDRNQFEAMMSVKESYGQVPRLKKALEEGLIDPKDVDPEMLSLVEFMQHTQANQTGAKERREKWKQKKAAEAEKRLEKQRKKKCSVQ